MASQSTTNSSTGLPDTSATGSMRGSTDGVKLGGSSSGVNTSAISSTSGGSGGLAGSGSGIRSSSFGFAFGSEEEGDARKKIQTSMKEAQQKNLVLLQRYLFCIPPFPFISFEEIRYQARADKLKTTYGEHNPAIQGQLSDLVWYLESRVEK